jgi:hypothetical protein
VVHAVDDRRVHVLLAWSRDHHALRAAIEVRGRFLSGGEESRRLDHKVDAEVFPWQLRGILVAEELDVVAVDLDALALRLDRRPERAQGGVVLQQVGESPGVADVVDGDDLEIGLARRRRGIDGTY